MSNAVAERPVRIRNLMAYGVGDIFGGGAFLVVGTLFYFFLVKTVGLSPILGSMVFAIGKIWDAISDPLMGYISDMTKSRFGRRRVYFLAGIIPIALAFISMWIPLNSSNQWVLFAYYSFAYVLFSTVFTMVMVPFAALNAEMTTSYKVRSRLSGARLIFSGVASILAGTIPKMIVNAYPNDEGMGYLVMAIGFGIFFALPFLIVFFGTWELPLSKRESNGGGSLSIFREFFTILKNKSFRVHLGMYVCSYTAMDVLLALFAFYITDYMKKPELFSVAMGAILITQTLMLPVYVFIGNKKGKGFAYIVGLCIWAAGMVFSTTLGPASTGLDVAIVCISIGLGTSAGVLMPWAILPSVIDVDELISGEMRSGTYSGAMTLVRKMVNGAIAIPLIGVVLQLIGFESAKKGSVAEVVNSPEVLQNLKLLFLVGPIVLIFFGIIVALRFKITPESHALLTAETERLKQGGSKADVTPETKKVCEELTGIPYEELYPLKG